MVAAVVLWLQMWSYGCRCSPMVAAVVLWLQMWSYGWSCGPIVVAVVQYLQLWSCGCNRSYGCNSSCGCNSRHMVIIVLWFCGSQLVYVSLLAGFLGCRLKPCQNGGTCQSHESGTRKYLCACVPGECNHKHTSTGSKWKCWYGNVLPFWILVFYSVGTFSALLMPWPTFNWFISVCHVMSAINRYWLESSCDLFCFVWNIE